MRPALSTELSAPVLLSAVLAAEGAEFVIVGSAALSLRGFDLPVGDLDVVADLDVDKLDVLCQAISRYRLPSRLPPSARTILAVDVWSTLTIYGKLDVLVERARHDGNSLRSGSSPIPVLDVKVSVASADDAWALRNRFKGATPVVPAVRP